MAHLYPSMSGAVTLSTSGCHPYDEELGAPAIPIGGMMATTVAPAPHIVTGSAINAGREGLRRLMEHDQYRLRVSISSTQQLCSVLAACATEFERSDGATRLAIVSGGGIVGYTAAIRLKQQYGFHVIVVEKRDEFSRKTVLDLKRSTVKVWPLELIERLVREKCMTRCACRAEDIAGRRKVRAASSLKSIIADLAEPQPQNHRDLLVPDRPLPPTTSGIAQTWLYPDPARDDRDDFYDTYALGETRALQAVMNQYCLDLGIDVMHGEVDELQPQAGEFMPGLQLHGQREAVTPPPELPVFIVIAEGNTPRLDSGFGGSEKIRVSEVWRQRNYRVQALPGVTAHGGGSAIEIDAESGVVTITQIWDGVDGRQANVSVLMAPGEPPPDDTPASQAQLDALFEKAQRLLERFGIPLAIDLDKETWRSPPIPITLTRATNPVHDNVMFIGDAAGLSSPFTSRSANDGVVGQIRIMEEYLCDPAYQSADSDLRADAQNRARAKFNAVYRIRHGTALDLMVRYGFYSKRQEEEIRASFARDRTMR